MVQEVRTLPTQDVLSPFGYHTFIAHIGDESANVIAVDKRTVTKHCRFLAEEFFHLLGLAFHFVAEDVLVDE